MFSGSDVWTARHLIDSASENDALSDEQRELVRRQDLTRLTRMTDHSRTTGCMRAYLLRYIAFSNAAPADMAANQPDSIEAFLEASGVGQVKAERYGQAFLQAIQTWEGEHGTGSRSDCADL